MAVSMAQLTAPTSPSTIPLGTVPSGGYMIISSTATSADVFLGTTSTVTSASGAPLDTAGPTTIMNPPTSQPFTVYGCAGTGTHVVGVIIVTPS